MRIGSWRLVKNIPYGQMIYFNPVTRLEIDIMPHQYPDGREYWAVYIFPKRIRPANVPQDKWPITSVYTYHKNFATKEDASKFVAQFRKKNPNSLQVLRNKEKENTRLVLRYFNNLLDRFFRGTAFMAPIGKGKWKRDNIVITARAEVEKDSLRTIEIIMHCGKFHRKVHLGFVSLNHSVDDFRKDEKYYLEKINEAALDIYATNNVLGIFKEVLHEHVEKKKPKPKPRKTIFLIGDPPEKPRQLYLPPFKEDR